MKSFGLKAMVLILIMVLSAPAFSLLLSAVFLGEHGGVFGVSWSQVLSFARGSVILLAVGLSIGLIVGGGAAYFCSRFQFPFRGVLIWASVLPLAVPGYLVSYSWVDLFDGFGWRSSFLRNEVFAGAVLGLSIAPYFFLPGFGAFSSIPKSFLEQANLLGGHGWRIKSLVRIEIPHVWPSLFAGGVLAAMEILSDFGTVDFLAVDTWTTGIFRQWYSFHDSLGALRLALILMLIIGFILSMELAVRSQRADFGTGRANGFVARDALEGMAGVSCSVFLALPVIAFVFIPLSWMIFRALTYLGTRAPDLDLFSSTLNTIFLATGTGFLVALVGLFVAALQRCYPSRFWRLLARLGTLGYALPGTVVALGILLLRAQLELVGIWIGVSLIFYAHAVRFSTIGCRVIEGGWSRIPLRFEEQSRVLGRSVFETFWHISLPLLRTSIGSVAVLTALDVIKELPATMLLRPFDFDTLSIQVYNLASDERFAEVAPASLLMVVCSMMALSLAIRFGAFSLGGRS